ncbi:MAG: alpha/beta fold hydrolase [Candidatus Coproplasma sp.]
MHGYLSKKESFYYQSEFFSSFGFKAVAPDFPAFGSSAPIESAWSVGDYAEWLINFVRAQKLDCPHIIAHSFGARVAFKALSSHNFADRLIITGGAGLVKPRSPAYMRQVKQYRRVKKLFPKFAERRFGSEEYRSLSPLMRESYKKIVNEDLRDCASSIKNKTLLIYGENDTVTPKDEEGKVFNTLIKDSRLEVITGGHFCFCENAELFNRISLAFLTE